MTTTSTCTHCGKPVTFVLTNDMGRRWIAQDGSMLCPGGTFHIADNVLARIPQQEATDGHNL